MDNNYFKKLFRFLCALIIWGLMVGIWAFVWYENYSDIILLPFYRKGNWMIVAVYGILLYFITQFYGGYRIGSYRRGDLIFSGIMSMLATNGITYLQTSLVGRQFMNGWPIIWMSLADFVIIWIWATQANKLYLQLNPPRHVLFVYGGNSMAQSLAIKMAERDDKYIIREAVNIDEGISYVIDRISSFNSILICDVKSSYRNRLVKYCYANDVRVYVTPKISDILIRGAENIHLFDTPLLLIRNEGLSLDQRIIKRLSDITLTVAGLLFFLPVMLVVSLAIKLEDGGPVIYKQIRLTQGGKEFNLYKFRTMIVDAEKQGGPQLARQNDARITRVGNFIRKIRMDELPQLINILTGDMSIVGPRPERPEIAAEYNKRMNEFNFRLKVKAGLTGYAQIMGKYNTTPYDKLKLDMMYITSYSFLLDLRLIFQTIKTLFIKDSTEGIDLTTYD